MVLTHLKEIELMSEQENESDEYRKSYLSAIVDAFVALGGYPTKEGTISKNTLIEIIKTEFELTIDMEVWHESNCFRNTCGRLEETRTRSTTTSSASCSTQAPVAIPAESAVTCPKIEVLPSCASPTLSIITTS